MDDIVIRLRGRNSPLADEAADQIEALRKRIAHLEKLAARARTRAADANGQSQSDIGGYRNDDPETSVDAAHKVNVSGIKYGIMTVLRDARSPLNGWEIAQQLSTPTITVVPRFPSMRAAHLIEPQGLRPGPSGRDQIAYVLTARGRAAVVQRAVL